MKNFTPSLLARRLCLAMSLCAMLGVTLNVQAQQTAKPIHLLVGFPPGGGSDAIARTLADKLKDELGVPVVVENKPGAGGQIAAQALKQAPADGTVLFLSHDHTISILPLVMKNPGYEPSKDFVPVAGFATFVNALAVSEGTSAKSFAAYVKYVQAHQNRDAVGIPAPASTPEFLVKLIGDKFKLDLVAAPYRGSAPMMSDMLGNQITAGVASVPDFIENHRAGKLHVVAVLGKTRQAALPDVPTFKELGLAGLEDAPYYGIFAPAGTPPTVIDRLTQAVGKVIALPDVHERLTHMGLNVGLMNSQQLALREKEYAKVWAKLIKDSGFVPQ